MARSRLQAVGEEDAALIGEEPPPPVEPAPRRVEHALTGLLITSLRALSQRAIVALSSLVDLALLASAFALWLLIIANPTLLQLTAVGGYAVFVLLSLYMRR